jgi:hypothetical protein
MAQFSLPQIGAALLAGAAGGALIASLLGPGSSAISQPLLVDADADSDGLLVRLDQLESDNAALRAAMRALEATPPSASTQRLRTPEGGYLSQADLDSFRKEMLAQMGSPRSGSAQAPVYLQDQVEFALDSIRAQEEAVEREERVLQVSAKIGGWLEMSDSQEAQFVEAWRARAVREAEIQTLQKSGTVSSEDIQARRQAMRTAIREDATRILSPDQFATFSARFAEDISGQRQTLLKAPR